MVELKAPNANWVPVANAQVTASQVILMETLPSAVSDPIEYRLTLSGAISPAINAWMFSREF